MSSNIKDKLRERLLQRQANATTATTKPAAERAKPAKAVKNNAFDKLMNANKNQQAADDDTTTTKKKNVTIKGLLDTVTLDEDRKCDDFERYLHRLHGRVVREITRKLQEHRNIKVQLQIDAHYEKLKPKSQPQQGGARTRKQRREEEERQRQQQEQRRGAEWRLCQWRATAGRSLRRGKSGRGCAGFGNWRPAIFCAIRT